MKKERYRCYRRKFYLLIKFLMNLKEKSLSVYKKKKRKSITFLSHKYSRIGRIIDILLLSIVLSENKILQYR